MLARLWDLQQFELAGKPAARVRLAWAVTVKRRFVRAGVMP